MDNAAAQQPEATTPNARGDAGLQLISIKSAAEYYGALQKICDSTPIRNGMIVAVTPTDSGRIGLFCNRYISGALLDSGEVSGLAALQRLMSDPFALLGFRPCMSTEGVELKQGLAIDLHQLLETASHEGTEGSPATLLPPMETDGNASRVLLSDESASHFEEHFSDSDTLFIPSMASAAPPRAVPTAPAAPTQAPVALTPAAPAPAPVVPPPASKVTSEDPAYRELPKMTFSQILKRVVPTVPEEANTPVSYKEMVKKQLRTTQDISQKKSPSSDTEAQRMNEDLQLYIRMLKAEEKRLDSWSAADLDNIPTPQADGASPFTDLCSDLITGTFPVYQGPKQPPKPAVSESEAEEEAKKKKKKTKLDLFIEKAKPIVTDKRFIKAAIVVAAIGVLAVGFFVGQIVHRDHMITLGISQLQSGKSDDAVGTFADVVRLYPESERGYYYRALAYNESGQPDLALTDINKALTFRPNSSLYLTSRAIIETRMHDYDHAIDDTTLVLLNSQQNVQAFATRGIAQAGKENYDKAVQDFTAALDRATDPTTRSLLYCQRGLSQAHQHNWDESIADLGEAIKLRPGESSFLQRGEAYLAKKDYARAVEDFTHVLKFDGRSYNALVKRGICQVRLKHLQEALTDFEDALKINGSGVEALMQRGALRFEFQDYKDAADDFEQVMRLNPYIKEAKDKYTIAVGHLKQGAKPIQVMTADTPAPGANAEATGIPEKTLPGEPSKLIADGYKHLNKGAVNDAILCFASAVRKDPSNDAARRYLAYAFTEKSDYADALEQLQALVTMGRVEPRDTLLLAQCQAKIGQPETAADSLTALIEARPDYLPAKAELARLSLSMGMPKKAMQLINEGMSKSTTPADRQTFEALLKQMQGGKPQQR